LEINPTGYGVRESLIPFNVGTKAVVHKSLAEGKRVLVKNQALERSEGNIAAAAKELGVSRPTCYELMNKLGISKDLGEAVSAHEKRQLLRAAFFC